MKNETPYCTLSRMQANSTSVMTLFVIDGAAGSSDDDRDDTPVG